MAGADDRPGRDPPHHVGREPRRRGRLSAAIAIPSRTNGNARPSLKPASALMPKCGSCSSPSSPGGPTPMSPASTGSVGRQSARRARSPRPRTAPSRWWPNSAASAMKAGMPIASSRATVLHSRQRSSARPSGRREQRDHHRELGHVLEQRRVGDRCQPADPEQREADRAHDAQAQVDQGRPKARSCSCESAPTAAKTARPRNATPTAQGSAKEKPTSAARGTRPG